MNPPEGLQLVLGGRPNFANNVSRWPLRLSRLGAYWKGRRERARQIQELFGSSDRELWDMGLSRSDLREIVNGTYRREKYFSPRCPGSPPVS